MIAYVPVADLAIAIGPYCPPLIGKPSSVTAMVPVMDMELAGTHQVEVEFSYQRGTPGVHTLSNGDPGYPDEPAEVEIHSIKCDHALVWAADDGYTFSAPAKADLSILFSPAGMDWLEGQCIKQAEKQIEDDAGEAAIDAYLDRQYAAEAACY